MSVPVFMAFFSYSHHDLETDPAYFAAFTVELERRVNSRLANARFEIWRDTESFEQEIVGTQRSSLH